MTADQTAARHTPGIGLSGTSDADLYVRGADTLLASWEQYARGAAGATLLRLAGVAAAVESDTALRSALEQRGYALDEATRAMGVLLDEIRLPRPEVELGPGDWSEHVRVAGLPGEFLSGADLSAFLVLVARLRGENASTALAFDFAGDCGIYNVVTLESARRSAFSGPPA